MPISSRNVLSYLLLSSSSFVVWLKVLRSYSIPATRADFDTLISKSSSRAACVKRRSLRNATKYSAESGFRLLRVAIALQSNSRPQQFLSPAVSPDERVGPVRELPGEDAALAPESALTFSCAFPSWETGWTSAFGLTACPEVCAGASPGFGAASEDAATPVTANPKRPTQRQTAIGKDRIRQNSTLRTCRRTCIITVWYYLE